MGSEGKNGGGGGGDVLPEMTTATRKTVQRLKEIVKDCTETEIYAMLVECNMEPNEAVQKLLSQGTFHEVKSKRDRRKEMKLTQDLRWRGGKDNVAQCGLTCTSSEAVVKGENESVEARMYSMSYSKSHAGGKTLIHQPPSYGAAFDADHKTQSTGTGDAITFSRKPPQGYQPAWLGASTENNVSDVVYEASSNTDQYFFNNEWSVIEQPIAASGSFFVDASATSDVVFSKPSNLYEEDKVNFSGKCLPNEVHISEGDRDSNSDSIGCVSASNRQMTANTAEGASHCDKDLSKDMRSFGSCEGKNEHGEAATEMQTLSIGKEDRVLPQTESKCDVVFPTNLQALTADCPHLRFGTYRSDNDSAFPRPPACSRKGDLVEPFSATNSSLARQLNIRDLENYGDEQQIGSMYDTQRETADVRNYDVFLSQPKLMKWDIAEGALGHEYFSSPIPGSNFTNIEQSSSVPYSAKLEPQTRNLSVPSATNACSNFTPDLLASAVLSMKDSDSLQSELLATQLMRLGYSGVTSSATNPFSMSKVLKSDTFSLPKPSSQTLSGSSFVTGLQSPKHHTALPFAQPASSLDQLTDIRGYPVVPGSRSYSSLPSDLQEAYPVSNSFQQSMAGMKYSLPRYKNGASVNQSGYDLHQAYGRPNSSYSGCGHFGSYSNFPESFLHSPSSASMAAANGYNELLRSQYTEEDLLTALRQNNISTTRDYGLGSKTAAVPDSAYYSLLAKNQQHMGHHQDQWPSHRYGDYQDLYQSQTGVKEENGQKSWGFDFERF